MSCHLIDLRGARFGRLTVIERAPNKGTQTHWTCRCECGDETSINGWSLRAGLTNSCGCLMAEMAGERARARGTGRSKHPLYHTWKGMVTRCENPRDGEWLNYGGRGLTVDATWREDFWAFTAWMDENLGDRPVGLSLDRIDNDRGYEPGNLRWANQFEQVHNQRARITNAKHDLVVAERDLWRERALALGWVDSG